MNRRNTLTLTFLALVILAAAGVAGVGLKVPSQNASQLQGGQVTPPSARPLGLRNRMREICASGSVGARVVTSSPTWPHVGGPDQ
jgi:hypothetical protein